MKKIAFSTTGNDLSAALDPRFGRANRFLIYDIETQTMEIIENNQNRAAAQGAGIQSAEAMIRAGVDTLITGHCGPKAFQVLEAAGVKVYNTAAETLQEALEMVQNGYLNPATAADKSEHW